MTRDEIVGDLTRRSWAFGVSVLLSPDAAIDCDGVKVGGYFCGTERKLAVATGRDEEQWLGILLHEYSHLTQWAEDATVWRDDARLPGNFDHWLAGKPCKNIAAILAVRRELEADCERRTVRLAKELEAPIDVAQYARAANSYIHFYNTILETRKWYPEGKGPYTRPDVLALCNDTIDKDFSKTPAKLRRALLTCV